MAYDDLALKHAVITAFRGQLERRYDLENIRRFEVVDEVPDKSLKALRRFFLTHVYPAAENRDRLDAASDNVIQFFKSPKRLLPMMGIAMTTLLRTGNMLSAASATRTTLEALLETRKIEGYCMKWIAKDDANMKGLKKLEGVAGMVCAIPKKEMDRFRNDVLRLFRSLDNVRLLAAGVSIMDRALEIMQGKRDVYSDADIEGFELGRDLLADAHTLYESLDPGDAERVLDCIDAIEVDWYDEMRELGGAP